eukprot:CAMPEP_0115163142 /NCGR_PEP_ID=MMETSP0227-20121206/72355_1 /TAXON_ID=89957 /ORGANISM="Polarella glacialis, Strain CCMP 1383" /LENGTH=78 /DNA_ID=CAMNT_0002575435 /DNA_START=22 /DNA_END=254 /DNA_ORIENTATION=+
MTSSAKGALRPKGFLGMGVPNAVIGLVLLSVFALWQVGLGGGSVQDALHTRPTASSLGPKEVEQVLAAAEAAVKAATG